MEFRLSIVDANEAKSEAVKESEFAGLFLLINQSTNSTIKLAVKYDARTFLNTRSTND